MPVGGASSSSVSSPPSSDAACSCSTTGYSTLLRKWKEGDIEGAAKSFGMWRFAQGKVLNGLVKRRKLESSLFLTPDGAGWSVETANTVNEG